MLQLVHVRSQSDDYPATDGYLREALKSLIQPKGEPQGSRILMAHEADALLRVLSARSRDDDRAHGLVGFLKLIDPLKGDGWDNARMEAYIASATATLDQALWLTRAFDHLDRAQAQVTKSSGMRLFRTALLKAAIAYFITQLPPEEVEVTHATGSDVQRG